jgi:hypothetical protein
MATSNLVEHVLLGAVKTHGPPLVTESIQYMAHFFTVVSIQFKIPNYMNILKTKITLHQLGVLQEIVSLPFVGQKIH